MHNLPHHAHDQRWCAGKYHQDGDVGLGEVGMSAILAGTFAVPAGIYLAGRTGIALAFILAMIVFIPLFVFLLKLIRWGMHADAMAVVDTF